MLQQFGLIGYPLGHSFSKKYFQDKIDTAHLNDRIKYDTFPLPSADLIPGFLDTPHLSGFNITIPYKEAIIPFLDYKSEAVDAIRSCNVVKIKNGSLYGYNTDIDGFEKSFFALKKEIHKKALVLGTGGASKAICYVLNKRDIPFKIVSRNKTDHYLSYNDLNKDILDEYNIIINTTPLGMWPNIDACPILPYSYITKKHYVYDLVYNPDETLLLKKAKEQGATAKNGLDMLYALLEICWEIWMIK